MLRLYGLMIGTTYSNLVLRQLLAVDAVLDALQGRRLNGNGRVIRPLPIQNLDVSTVHGYLRGERLHMHQLCVASPLPLAARLLSRHSRLPLRRRLALRRIPGRLALRPLRLHVVRVVVVPPAATMMIPSHIIPLFFAGARGGIATDMGTCPGATKGI